MDSGIEALVYAAIDKAGSLMPTPVDCEKGRDTEIFGEAGQMDSMSLVSLIVALEELIEGNLGVSLTLVSESAMSRRRSPFSTVGSLADYVEELIAENQHA